MKRTVFLLFRSRISKDYPEVACGLYTRARIFLCAYKRGENVNIYPQNSVGGGVYYRYLPPWARNQNVISEITRGPPNPPRSRRF